MGVRVVGGNYPRKYWCNGSGGGLLRRRGPGWSRGGRSGSMRNEEGATVDSWCGDLWVSWFGITWKWEKIAIKTRSPEEIMTVI